MTNSESIEDADLIPDGRPPGVLPQEPALPSALGYLAALVMTGFATLLAFALESAVSIPNLSLVFVLPVIIAAILFGFGPSMLAAVAGALAYNFFFTAPRLSLQVEDPANVWAIGLLFVVGGIASSLASLAARRKAALRQRMHQEQAVRRFSQAIAGIAQPGDIARRAAASLEDIFGVPVSVWMLRDGGLEQVAATGQLSAGEGELAAARAALEQDRFTRAGVYPFDASRFDFWPIRVPGRQPLVLGLAFDHQEYPEHPEVFVEVIGRLSLLAMTSRDGSTGRL